MNHVCLSLFCLFPFTPFWGLKMRFYHFFLSLFIFIPLPLSSCFSGVTRKWKTSFMYRGFRDDTLLSGGSIVVLGEYCLESQHSGLCFNRKWGRKCLSAELFENSHFEIFGGWLVSTAWKICNGKMFLLLKIKIIFFSSRKYFVPSQRAKSAALVLRGGAF